MDGLTERRDWTGSWVVVDRTGAVLDASLPWSRLGSVEAWFVPDSVKAWHACFRLTWAGLSDVPFESCEGRVVHFAAEPDRDGWRLTCIDQTVRARIGEAERQADRVHVLTDFAGAIARELIDPMSIVQAKIDVVLDLGITDPVIVRRHLEVAIQHAERVSNVLDNLRQISRPGSLTSERWSVAALFEEVMVMLGTPIRPKVQLNVEAGLFASGPRAIAVRVVASLLRAALERRTEVCVAARIQRGQPVVLIGPSAHRRGRSVPPAAAMSSHEPLVRHLGGRIEAYSDGHDTWVELMLAPAPPLKPRRASQIIQMLVLGSSAFLQDVEHRLGPKGFACRGTDQRDGALGMLREGSADLALFDVDLPGPGPRGHALALDLAARFPALPFFVALPADIVGTAIGRVEFLRWPADTDKLVRVARNGLG